MPDRGKTVAVETVDFYWSFRSHYCYLALDRVRDLESDFKVRINIRPVFPIAIRMPEFFARQPRNPNRLRYVVADAERIAAMLDLPFAWPDPDPVVMNEQTLEVAEQQPYIYQLTGFGVAACRRGKGLDFTSAVARLIWGGTKGWDRGSLLSNAAADVGLDLAELEADINDGPNSYADEIRRNEETLEAAGHWGVPTLVVRNEPFFGQDRIDVCRWRLEQYGLKRK